MTQSPRPRLLAYLRARYPDEDDEQLYTRMEAMELDIRWRQTQIVQLVCSVCKRRTPSSELVEDGSRPMGFRARCHRCHNLLPE